MSEFDGAPLQGFKVAFSGSHPTPGPEKGVVPPAAAAVNAIPVLS
jgi:hypothetical protein